MIQKSDVHQGEHMRNARGELVPGCVCGWRARHAYYGDEATITKLAEIDWRKLHAEKL